MLGDICIELINLSCRSQKNNRTPLQVWCISPFSVIFTTFRRTAVREASASRHHVDLNLELPWIPLEHHVTLIPRGLRVNLDWSPVMPIVIGVSDVHYRNSQRQTRNPHVSQRFDRVTGTVHKIESNSPDIPVVFDLDINLMISKWN